MMIIENTTSICLRLSSHSSCIIAASSSESYSDEEEEADEGREGYESLRCREVLEGNGIGMLRRGMEGHRARCSCLSVCIFHTTHDVLSSHTPGGFTDLQLWQQFD